MNSCQHTEKILAYRLGLLTERETREFENHLQMCSVCQLELQIESSIENELSVALQPGFIENQVRARIQLSQAKDMRSFWFYTLRMAIYGVVATVIGLLFTSFILRFPFGKYFDIGKYVSGLSDVASLITTSIHPLLLIIGLGYILIILSTLYSFARIQK